MTDDLCQVLLIGLPVSVHAQSQEHSAELMREMFLIAQQRHEEPQSLQQRLPARLLALVEELNQRFAGLTTDQDLRLAAAVEAGIPAIDLVYHLPVVAAEAARHLGDILDEADEFCRAGRHLLTLATPVEALEYRHWFLGQIVDQLDGEQPTSWSEYRDSRQPAELDSADRA